MEASNSATAYEKGQLYQLNPNDLRADPDQPRKVMDAQGLEDMTASVGTLGVIQPIIFRSAADGNLIVVAGERRVAAARQKKDPNEPQAAFDMMDKATTKIQSIDTSAWTEDDKTNFQTSLTSLKTEIDNYLSAAPAVASSAAVEAVPAVTAAPATKKTSKKPA